MEKTVIVFVPGYCLYKNGKRLTAISYLTTEEGIRETKRLSREGVIPHLVFSTTYASWEKEAAIKKDMAKTAGINPQDISILEAVTKTRDEIEFLKKVVEKFGTGAIVLIAEKYHAPRAEEALRKNFSGVEIIRRDVEVNKFSFERTLEPSRIKSIRAGNKFLWRLWNWLFGFKIIKLILRA